MRARASSRASSDRRADSERCRRSAAAAVELVPISFTPRSTEPPSRVRADGEKCCWWRGRSEERPSDSRRDDAAANTTSWGLRPPTDPRGRAAPGHGEAPRPVRRSCSRECWKLINWKLPGAQGQSPRVPVWTVAPRRSAVAVAARARIDAERLPTAFGEGSKRSPDPQPHQAGVRGRRRRCGTGVGGSASQHCPGETSPGCDAGDRSDPAGNVRGSSPRTRYCRNRAPAPLQRAGDWSPRICRQRIPSP